MRGDRLKVLAEVERGPATSRDVAEATGVPFACVTAHLSYLFGAGLLQRREIEGRRVFGHPVRIYSVPSNT